jgi:hypothetical protein
MNDTMTVAVLKATGERFAVRYDLRQAVNPETHLAEDRGVRCWGKLHSVGRNGNARFEHGADRCLKTDEITIEVLPRYRALRSLTLAKGTRWTR